MWLVAQRRASLRPCDEPAAPAATAQCRLSCRKTHAQDDAAPRNPSRPTSMVRSQIGSFRARVRLTFSGATARTNRYFRPAGISEGVQASRLTEQLRVHRTTQRRVLAPKRSPAGFGEYAQPRLAISTRTWSGHGHSTHTNIPRPALKSQPSSEHLTYSYFPVPAHVSSSRVTCKVDTHVLTTARNETEVQRGTPNATQRMHHLSPLIRAASESSKGLEPRVEDVGGPRGANVDVDAG